MLLLSMLFKLVTICLLTIFSINLPAAETCTSLAANFFKNKPQSQDLRPLKMKDKFLGEHNKQVSYLTHVDRQHHILNFEHNSITKGNHDFSCEAAICEQIYVMSPDKKIYMGTSIQNKFHHSSFLAGNDIISAGTIRLKYNRIIYLDNQSGHYQPDLAHTLEVLRELHQRGQVIPDQVRITLGSDHEYVDLNFDAIKSAIKDNNLNSIVSEETDYLEDIITREMGIRTIHKYVSFLDDLGVLSL